MFAKSKEVYITNSDYLYEKAIEYLYETDDYSFKDQEQYKLFIDYKGFGITEDEEYKYVYMWVLKQSYYVKNNKIISGPGSSMPYKFRYDKDDILMDFETPKDGSEYVKSIKKMYPDDIEQNAIGYQWKDDRLIKEVREYYSDLKDNNIYYYVGDEYIKLDI